MNKDETSNKLSNVELNLIITLLKKDNAKLKVENSELKSKIDILNEQLGLARDTEFGRSSEKGNNNNNDDEQVFDEILEPKNKEELDVADEQITVPAHKRKKNGSGRKALPADLPREQEVYDLADADKICSCGCNLTLIGTEISERLEIIPAKIFVIEQIRNKYACRGCSLTMRQAKLPPQPIPKSIAGPGILAHTVVSKYQDHLPLYRQEKMYMRAGIDIPRNTMSNWLIKGYSLLLPLERLLLDNIVNYDVAFADETRVQVLKEPERDATKQSYMWCFLGGPPEKQCCVYRYSPSRSHTVAKEVLAGFEGYLHSDGYSGYDALSKQQKITQVGCWYHCRRYFVKAEKISNKKGLASWAIKQIAQLAKIEKEIVVNNYTTQQKYDLRKQQALPIVNEIFSWCEKHVEQVVAGSLIGKAIKYTLNQREKLSNYLLDGRLDNNNNCSERLMKAFATGRKNWLFCNSVAGANASSLYYSLINTCEINNINPFKWFKYAFKKVPCCTTTDELETLLPYNIDKSLLE